MNTYEMIDDVRSRIINDVLPTGNPYTFDEIVDSFTDEEVECMREYFTDSEIPFEYFDIYRKEDMVYTFMKLVCVECITTGDVEPAYHLMQFIF